jgi:primary-amine oxidase
VTDMEMVVCDPWSVHLPPADGGRLIQLFMYLRIGHEMDNAYAHPIDFVPVLDLNLKKVSAMSLST